MAPSQMGEELSADELKELTSVEEIEDDDLPNDIDDEEDEEPSEPEGDDDEEQEKEGEEEEVEAKPKKGTKVDIASLHEERGKRKQAEITIQQERERFARLEARTEQLLELVTKGTPKEEEKEVIPDKATDPIGYMEYLEKRLSKIETGSKQTEEQTQQQQETAQMLQYGNTLAAQVRAKDPVAYDEALTFVVSKRAAELRALGTPEHEVVPRINQEMTVGMRTALMNKKNPGDFLLEFAKAGGWAKKAAAAKGDNIDVEKLAENKDKNKTLGSGGGTEGGSTKGLARALADMSDEEFKTWYNKKTPKGGKNKEFAKAFSE